MGRRGPKKLPARTHKKRGTHRDDRHGGPDLRGEMPQMPPDLSPAAQAAWNIAGAKLVAAGLIADLDGLALRMLADSVALYLEACDIMREEGIVVDGATRKISHPAVRIRAAAWAQIAKMCQEFGMTPAARTGLHVEQKPAREEDLARILGLRVVH